MLLFLSDINWLTYPGGMLTFIERLRTGAFSVKLSGVLQYNKTAKASHYEQAVNCFKTELIKNKPYVQFYSLKSYF